MVIWNKIHTISLYANRWGGNRYRTAELLKFVNKHLFDKQIRDLLDGKKVNTILASEAVLSANHTPYYMKSLQMKKENAELYEIEDELGFKATFPKGTKILTYYPTEYGVFAMSPIELIKPGEERVINFELVEDLRNDKLNHHEKFSENFYKIKCKSEDEAQTILYDSLTSMMIARKTGLNVERISAFDNKNCQEIILVNIIRVEKVELKSEATFEPVFSNFSYSLTKDRNLSSKSKNRYQKTIGKSRGRKYLDLMRSRVFRLKKSKIDFDMELIHEKSSN